MPRTPEDRYVAFTGSDPHFLYGAARDVAPDQNGVERVAHRVRSVALEL